jgi:hypothetical protein
MKQLEQTKGIAKLVPTKAKRYFVTFWTKANGWEVQFRTTYFTNPESAVSNFIERQNDSNPQGEYKPEFYKVIEVELEIPTL